MNLFGRHIPVEVAWMLGGILAVLILTSLLFRIAAKLSPSPLKTELITRTNSWWLIASGVIATCVAPKWLGMILIGYLSFVALREMFSIGRFREADRSALFVAYFAIPIQYFLVYHNHYEQFLAFIPLIMFISLPVLLVLKGSVSNIGRSMSMIPAVLIMTVYMLSHIAMLFNVNVPGFSAGSGGLILYLIILTAFNDVFQFSWGKLLGKRKILPKVSPNKTWEGFIGGILTTAGLAMALNFLTPLNLFQCFITGLFLGIMGFFGDTVVSAIKRDLGIKDTDDLLPGHGGAMDRMDSIMFTAPLFYHLLRFFTGTA